MSYLKPIFGALLILFTTICFSETKQNLLHEGTLAVLAPPVVNKDYYLLEFGYLIQKKMKVINYEYNAYVSIALFEDWKERTDNLRAGALGFKGGVLFPVPWVPLFMKMGAGFAKTALHKNPVFGKAEQSVSRKNMYLFELGVLYNLDPDIDHFFISFTYQKNSVSYFKRDMFLAFGVNY